MKPHVLEIIEIADVNLWRHVCIACMAIPDDILGAKLSCHMLACAAAKVFPELTVQHGYIKPGYEHSWCITSHGNIMDVYPIGVVGGPLLIHREAPIHHYETHKEIVKRRNLTSEKFERQVREVEQRMRNNIFTWLDAIVPKPE